MYCPNCGKDSVAGSKFCESCGTVLPTEQNAQAAGQQYNNQTPPPQQQAPPYGQPQYGQPYGQPMYAPIPLKSAGLAAVLAFLWAGLGHIYLGLITKGILYMILYIVLWVVSFFLIFFTFGISLIIPFIFWIWQVYDAYKLANQYNSTVQQTGRAPW
ncbi:MAG: TM2 domain-containing protein [Methanomassiliicoccus sp.]|nr:TM2 domain-containing protein [Methanomassiliicoccus sp.]